MKYYIPFSLRDGDHAIYDVITSIVGAEGFAPSEAAAFNGIETPRSSPAKFTGYHPLNPFVNRVLVYNRMPVLSEKGEYADAWENTVYLCVEADALEIPGVRKLVLNENHPLNGVELYFTNQALLFKDPLAIAFVFMSEKLFKKCEGCRSGVNVKNEKEFGYRTANRADMEAAVVLDDSQVGGISVDALYGSVVDSNSYVSTWEAESLHGAVLGYKLVKRHQEQLSVAADGGKTNWQKFCQFKEWIGNLDCLHEDWHGRDLWRDVVARVQALPSFLKTTEMIGYSRSDDFGTLDAEYKVLMQRFVKLAVSLKLKNWNWADKECKASFAEAVMNECIFPLMKEKYPEHGKIEAMSKYVNMVARRFREPNNIHLDFHEENLKSNFVRALYKFLESDGRLDRIAEYLHSDSGLDIRVREVLAAMYGAFKGYAQISVKKLAIQCESLDALEKPKISNKIDGLNTSGKTDAMEIDPEATGDRNLFGEVMPKKVPNKPKWKWMTNGSEKKRVPVDEISGWLENGYHLGTK